MDKMDIAKIEKQYKEVIKLKEKRLKKGDTWFLIECHWFKQWKKYATNDGYDWSNIYEFHPGQIDNKPLYDLDDGVSLRKNLAEEIDYELIPHEAWDTLKDAYGVIQGQEPIPRKVIEIGMFVKEQSIEIYPITLKLCTYNDQENTKPYTFSKLTPIFEIETLMIKLLSVPKNKESRIWNAYLEDNFEICSKSKTVEESGLQCGQKLIIETKTDDGKWLKNDGETKNGWFSKSTSNGKSSSSSYFSGKASNTSGLCGLSNLGNTCFMNSALQCLSNVPPLTEYFYEEKYMDDLNTNNPLGMGGKLAKAYARHIQKMWSGENSSYAPRDFKTAVGQFAPRFSGYQQHDSQELLSFLVDGLHEDLNRITKKPYVEIKEAEGREDSLVAEESWNNHRKRNDSIIVDLLHGLFKSTVDCPDCDRVSVTFDPFCYMSLPLPARSNRKLECLFCPVDYQEDVLKYKLSIPKKGVVTDIYTALSDLNQIPADRMLATDVYNARFHKIFKKNESTGNIYDRDLIYIYEAPMEATMIPVYMRSTGSGAPQLFGLPILIPVSLEGTTYSQLYKTVLRSVVRYIEDEDLSSRIEDFLVSDGEVVLEVEDQDREQVEENGDNLIQNLFKFKIINSYGTQDLGQIKENDGFVELTEQTYLAADWPNDKCGDYFVSKWSSVEQIHTSAQASDKPSGGVQLRDCVKLFTTQEKLGQDNAWYCSQCKQHQQATKKFDLWNLPPILIIHFKRFSYTRWSRDKLDTLVNFPLRDLDLSEFVVNPEKVRWAKEQRSYNLIAVSNHYGGLGGGHYTAYAKNCRDHKWHYFDDSGISSVPNESTVVTKAAYMLVYQRQDLEEWSHKNPGKNYKFMDPLSPRGQFVNGSNFQYNDDQINNNNAEDMDLS